MTQTDITRTDITDALESDDIAYDIENRGTDREAVVVDVSGSGVETRNWRCEIYWDSQDQQNEGWAWRTTRDGDVSSGSLDSLAELADVVSVFLAAVRDECESST